ncbi:hypothetical protein ACH194_07130 [Proteus mirabilis]|uniref:hypothetical protein n=1 Tax=Proteus mirabilis TaxID=584 RepID=UPI003787036A
MSNQNLEALVSTLSAQVVQQGQQIAELQKQLADMQKATSCELDSAFIAQSTLTRIR